MVLICLRYCELKFPWTFYAYSTFLVFKMYFFRNKQDEIFSTNAIYKQDMAQNTVKYFKKEFKQCLTIKSLIGRNNGEMWHHMWFGEKKVWCAFPPSPPSLPRRDEGESRGRWSPILKKGWSRVSFDSTFLETNLKVTCFV